MASLVQVGQSWGKQRAFLVSFIHHDVQELTLITAPYSIHDMGWKERPIFGKIRFMNYAGCKRKFKVDQFVAQYKGAAENAAKLASSSKKAAVAKMFAGKKRKAADKKQVHIFYNDYLGPNYTPI